MPARRASPKARTASARLLPPLASCARWPCSCRALGRAWHFVDVSKLDPAARAIRIDLALPQAASVSPLHISMTLREDGSLVETAGQGVALRERVTFAFARRDRAGAHLLMPA